MQSRELKIIKDLRRFMITLILIAKLFTGTKRIIYPVVYETLETVCLYLMQPVIWTYSFKCFIISIFSAKKYSLMMFPSPSILNLIQNTLVTQITLWQNAAGQTHVCRSNRIVWVIEKEAPWRFHWRSPKRFSLNLHHSSWWTQRILQNIVKWFQSYLKNSFWKTCC